MPKHRTPRSRRPWRAAALALGLALLAPGLGAQEAARDASPGPPVPLDALLRLPPAGAAPAPEAEVGGATRKQWRDRFVEARADVQAAETRLAEAQAELEKLASGSESWQVAAPGGATAGSETGPLSFSLRQEIRRSREELERTQQALSELRIQANLAGVPAEWMGEDATAPAP